MHPKNPLISIIIATYNAAKTLDKCLASIECQIFREFEIIIVDGLSTDDTVQIIERHSGIITYWHTKKDSGIYDAWNQAIEKATGEYICFVGADDAFSDETSLSRLFEQVGRDKYDLVSSKGLFLSARKNHVIGKPWNYNKISRRITICHPGLLHHRSLFERFGKFNAKYRIVGDYEFLLRLPAETTSLHVDEITVHIADGGISRSRYMDMLSEKRLVQSQCLRIGKFKATYNYYEKICKIPIAKLFGLSY